MQISSNLSNYNQQTNQEIKKIILQTPTEKLPKVIEKLTPPIDENKIKEIKGFEIYA